MVIRQGDIHWLNLDEPKGSEPGHSHPVVVKIFQVILTFTTILLKFSMH